MKKMFVIAEGKRGVFIQVENEVITSVYQLQKENVPIFGNSAELPNIQEDLRNRFGKVDEVYIFVRDKLYVTQLCSRDEDLTEKIKGTIQKMKGRDENLKETDFAYKTHLVGNTYLNSIYKTNSIRSLKNFFKDIGWGEVKYIGPLELFIFANNIEQYKKAILLPINNGFIFFDNKKIFLSNKENLALLTKGVEEIFVTYPDPLMDSDASFKEIQKIVPQVRRGRLWLTLKGIATKPGEGIEWGYLIYYFEKSGAWREDFNFIVGAKEELSISLGEKKEEVRVPEKKNIVAMVDSGIEIVEETEELKPKNTRRKEIRPRIKVERKISVKKEKRVEPERKKISISISKDIFSGFSFKALLVASISFILIFMVSYFLPEVLPYKTVEVNIQNSSLNTILKNQPTTILFKNQKEFYEGKFYVLNDGSEDVGTFIDKATCLKEAAALGSQIKVFEVEKANNVEVKRTQISS
jgi:hypothetical protein